MGNRPPNIDRFVRLMSKYLPIRPPYCIKDCINYNVICIEGRNGTRITYYNWYNEHYSLTLAGRDFWTVCGPLGVRDEHFPGFLDTISTYHLDYQIRELVRHIIEYIHNDLPLLFRFRDSIDRRLQELRRRRIVDQGKILVCESMLRICIMGFDNLENDIELLMSRTSPPCDEIPAQPTHVEIRTQLA